MTDIDLTEPTARIATAYVGANMIAPDAVPALITGIHGALTSLGAPTPEAPPEPAVSVRKSVQPDHLACLECGAKFKMLKRHLRTEHGLSPSEYRARFGLPESYPMVASDYAEVRARLAKDIGLGTKANRRKS